MTPLALVVVISNTFLLSFAIIIDRLSAAHGDLSL